MSKQTDAKSLVEAVLCGELTLDAALEQQLGDDDADMESIHAALCYANLGQLDRVLDVPGEPNVAQFIEQFGLGIRNLTGTVKSAIPLGLWWISTETYAGSSGGER